MLHYSEYGQYESDICIKIWKRFLFYQKVKKGPWLKFVFKKLKQLMNYYQKYTLV